MPRNDQPWQEVRFGVRRPGATQAATSNVSGTLKTRLRAHGGSGQHRPIGVGRAAPSTRSQGVGIMASAVSLSALVSCE